MGKPLLLLAVLVLGVSRIHAEIKLVTEPYPGSVKIAKPSGESASHRSRSAASYQIAFLSKDDPSKVSAYYKPKAQKTLAQSDGSMIFVIDEWPTGGEMGPMQACVHVHVRASEKEEDLPVFEQLYLDVPLGRHSQAEYDKIHAKYRHLNSAFFNYTTTKNSSGKTLDAHDALYAQYQQKLKGGQAVLENQAKDTGKKIQELMKQGKTAEAGELMKQVSGSAIAASKKDLWPMWLEFLEKVEIESYPTLFVIDQGRTK
jgi:hypothetical protein